MKTPVNLITGFLGVGKTTAILDLLARRPAGSRWAVLMNEFGQAVIDGATLAQDGVAVREVPAGLGHPAGVIDVLRGAGEPGPARFGVAG
jgi:hypothetical protein